MEPLVTGHITFQSVRRPIIEATVYINLEDVTQADRASVVVAQQVIESVTIDNPKQTSLPFVLRGQLDKEKANYNVFVHVDVDNDRKVSQGDYLSAESYPVLTHGYPTEIAVEVVPV